MPLEVEVSDKPLEIPPPIEEIKPIEEKPPVEVVSEDFVIEYEETEGKPPPKEAVVPEQDQEREALKTKLEEKDKELLRLSWKMEELEKRLSQPPPVKDKEEPEFTDAQLKAYLEEQGNSPEAQMQVWTHIAKREAKRERADAEKTFATAEQTREFRNLETQILSNRSEIKDPMVATKVANLRKSMNLDNHPAGSLLAFGLYKFWEAEESKTKGDVEKAREKKVQAAAMPKTKVPGKESAGVITPEHKDVAERLGLTDMKLYQKFLQDAAKE